jgi:nucleotide-binding universal stress UspA family protein
MADTDEWRDETIDDPRPRRAASWPGAIPARIILVPVDFSLPSRHALAWALEHALHTPGEIHTLHVIDRRWRRSDLEADTGALRDELAEVHAAAAAELGRFFDDDARARIGSLHEHVSTGAPADEILALASALGASMVVIGSHGLGGLERWLLGSVAEKVVRGAACPVVVVKPPVEDRTTP